MTQTPRRIVGLALPVLIALAGRARAQDSLSASERAAIDAGASGVLASTGAPSASIAVVRNGHLAYTQAYGSARLDPNTPARPDMRYSVGSISKQFTATAILLLAEQGKLTLDDKVSRWIPGLTRGNEVSIRELLSMTSGYQDYWPQDYVMPDMLQPTTAHHIIDLWAKKPLDFEPGSKWQYSNTNYVIAGQIVEKASGQPLLTFLQQHIFGPLGMKTITNVDSTPLGPQDPRGYLRYALGPLRAAPKEGPGWLFAAGELAMTGSDLARWDISVIDQKVLKPASYKAQQTEMVLTNGVGTGYGFGVNVGMVGAHRRVSHNGEVSGFTAQNEIYPEDRTAIVVLTNLDATGAPGQIAARIRSVLFDAVDAESMHAADQARKIFEGLQHGQIDRSRFTSNANAYFSAQAIADFQTSLGPLGPPTEFTPSGQSLRGGMVFRAFRIRAGAKTLTLTTFTLPDGKLEQYQIAE